MQDVDLLKKSKKDDLLENLTMRSKNHSKSELLPFDLLFDFQVNLGRFTAFVGELFSFSVFFFFLVLTDCEEHSVTASPLITHKFI